MTRKYQYLRCLVQFDKVTFINDDWQGSVPLEAARTSSEPFSYCPSVLDVLNKLGEQGWELVSVVQRVLPTEQGGGEHEHFYLRRESEPL